METTFAVLRPDGSRLDALVHWPERPPRRDIEDLVRRYLDGADVVHLPVLSDARVRDMFVADLALWRLSERDVLGVNRAATALYRALLLRGSHQGYPAAALPAVLGTAVVFDRTVWA